MECPAGAKPRGTRPGERAGPSPPQGKIRWGCIFSALLAATLNGCASRPQPVVSPPPPGYELSGLASWYGHPFHGRRTASGERYNMHTLTAAHRTLPFDTIVRVERLDTRGTVNVRINDRGPFIDGRVIDLSRESARRLNMIGVGVAPVRIVPLRVPPGGVLRWAVLVGRFSREEDARRFAGGFRARWKDIRVVSSPGGPVRYFHAQLNSFQRESDAREMFNRLRREGYTAFLTATR